MSSKKSSLKTYSRTKTNSVEFKRRLIMKVREHPSVWTNYDSQEKLDAWRTIEKELADTGCLLRDIQSTWTTLRSVYFRKIFIRTIERNFEAPDWVFFHDMTFLYENVKEDIQKKLGGISPPLFKPKRNSNRTPVLRCPCCVQVRTYLSSGTDMTCLQLKEETKLVNLSTETSKLSLPNDQCDTENSISSVHSEEIHSIGSLYTEDTEDLCSDSTNRAESEPNDHENSLPQPPSQDLIDDKICAVIDLLDDNEKNDESSNSRLIPVNRKNMTDNNVIELFDDNEKNDESSSLSLLPADRTNVTDNNSSEDIHDPAQKRNSIELNTYLLNGNYASSLPESESRSILLSQSLDPRKATTNEPDIIFKLKSHEQRLGKGSKSRLSESDRLKVIEAVKANPECYLGASKKNRSKYNFAWKQVAKELNQPLPTVRNRWRLIKTRYLKELVFERYSNGLKKSSWESFKRLEFFRPYMQEEIDEIHRTRLEMKDAIRKRAEQGSLVVKSKPELKDTQRQVIENVIKESQNLGCNEQTESKQAHINTNENLENTNVLSLLKPLKTYCKQRKDQEQSVVSDANILPNVQNLPLKISAVQAVSTFDLTSEPDEDEINENKEAAPPPLKKLRKSTESELQNHETHLLSNQIDKVLPAFSVPVSDEATTNPVTILKPKAQQKPPAKVFPPLDLTLDDDPDDLPVSQTQATFMPTSSFQQVFMTEFAGTNTIFPTLDLTADEDNNVSKDPIKNDNELASKSEDEKTKEKDDDNVICLDDDDSVGSYEEVIVYMSEAK